MKDLTSAVEALCGSFVPARIPVPCVTDRLELRPFREEDTERFARLMGDPVATTFIGGRKSLAAAADSVRYMRDAFAGRGWGTLAVVQRRDKAWIGYCGVRPLSNTPYVELAFALDRGSWNCGYATEATQASLDLAFDHLAIDSVFATVYPENSASIRVLTKLGMSLHGSIFGDWPRNSALLYRLDRRAWLTSSSKANGTPPELTTKRSCSPSVLIRSTVVTGAGATDEQKIYSHLKLASVADIASGGRVSPTALP